MKQRVILFYPMATPIFKVLFSTATNAVNFGFLKISAKEEFFPLAMLVKIYRATFRCSNKSCIV